ncbi:MAG TPA: hypothetical protein VGJ14_08380 [Sporichthyaceae bacterium]|jgi:hypothetical protein
MALTRPVRRAAIVSLGMLVLAGAAAVTLHILSERVVLHEACTATAGGTTVHVSLEQADNAATISAVAARRALPARAATIALATALQESKLQNLDHGDRDSLGLFQQRPSQGWGTSAEVMDPVHAANAFFDALIKIDGYKTMDIGEAAQKVQRSGYPHGYDKHEPRARVLASTLMGYSPSAFTCAERIGSLDPETPGPSGHTARMQQAIAALEAAFGPSVDARISPLVSPRTLDVRYPETETDSRRAGWAGAQWAVARAKALGLASVAFDGRVWTASKSARGWQQYRAPSGSQDPADLLRDQVRIMVR